LAPVWQRRHLACIDACATGHYCAWALASALNAFWIKAKPFSQIFQSGSDVWDWQTARRQNRNIASATAPGITVLAVFLGAGCHLTIEYAACRRFAIDRSLAIERLRFAS
jgi:endonuclease YncB( thermonuclease family)